MTLPIARKTPFELTRRAAAASAMVLLAVVTATYSTVESLFLLPTPAWVFDLLVVAVAGSSYAAVFNPTQLTLTVSAGVSTFFTAGRTVSIGFSDAPGAPVGAALWASVGVLWLSALVAWAVLEALRAAAWEKALEGSA